MAGGRVSSPTACSRLHQEYAPGLRPRPVGRSEGLPGCFGRRGAWTHSTVERERGASVSWAAPGGPCTLHRRAWPHRCAPSLHSEGRSLRSLGGGGRCRLPEFQSALRIQKQKSFSEKLLTTPNLPNVIIPGFMQFTFLFGSVFLKLQE